MMKKIFALVLLLVLGKLSYAQYPITQTLGSDSTIVISKGALQSRLINVTYTDTAAANLQRIRQYPGAQIATTTGGLNLWVRNANATAWIPVATGSGNNIYTIDGTLLGNRTLTGAGYSLTFNQLSKLLFNADSTTINTDQATISNNGVSTLSVKGATGRMFLVDTTAPADERIYELKSSNGEFYISILNDAQTSNDSAFLITSASRVGINTLNPDSTLKVGGGVNILGGLRVGNLPTSPGTKQLRINAQGQFSVTDTLIDAGGTVTSVGTNNGSGITGGPITTTGTLAIDTTNVIATKASVSGGLAGKLNLSDTAAMLAPYLRAIDTASLSNRINLKVNISDTATMLGNYLNNVGYGLSKAGQVASADSATLSAYYLRRKDSLTVTNPLGYVTQKILADTAAAIRSSDLGGTVTSVATNNGTGITGGTITTSGTLAIDTTVISTRAWRQKGVDSLQANINLKLNISDTASMLNPYLRKVDTASLSNRINQKLNISDTASMLTNYVNNVGYGLSKAGQVVSADSATLSAYYLRRKDSLTTTNPLGYVTRKILADTAAAIRSADAGGTVTSVATNNGTGITGGTITTSGTLAIDTLLISTRAWRQKGVDSLQANINLKLNISDTASMLSPYLRKADTTAMLNPYFRLAGVGLKNTGQTVYADTLLLSTRAWRQKGIDSVAALANTKISGSLISGYLTKATGTLTVDTSQIYQNNGNIGIGTISPASGYKVDMVGSLRVGNGSSYNKLTINGNTVGSYLNFQKNGTNKGDIGPYSAVLGGVPPYSGSNDDLTYSSVGGHFFNTNAGIKMYLNNAGNLGLSASPDSMLTVLEGAYFQRGVRMSGLPTAVGTKSLRVDASGTLSLADTLANGVSGSGTTNYVSKFTGTNAVGNSSIFDNGSAVGIGTSTPSSYGNIKGLTINGVEGGLIDLSGNGVRQFSVYTLSDGSAYLGTTTNASLFLTTNGTPNSVLTNAGKFGIGTITPDSMLMVTQGAYFQRGVRMSGLPSSPGTKALRINANGTLSIADTLIDAGGTVTSVATNNGTGITGGTITSTGTLAIDTLLLSTRAWRQKGIDSVAALVSGAVSGTTNYIPKFTSSSAIGNSVIYESGGSIGIGTTSLDLVGSTTSLTIDQSSGNGQLSLAANGTVRGRIFADNSTSELRIGNPTANPVMFFTNNTERMRLDASGNLYLNTTSGTGRLVIAQSNATQPAITLTTDESTIQGPSANTKILMGGNLSMYGANILTFGTGTTERARIDASGNLGINTSSPTEKLTVIGKGLFESNSNAAQQVIVKNTTAGNSSAIAVELTTDASGGGASIGKYSSSTTPYKMIGVSNAFIYNGTAGDISILNDFASGSIKLAAGSSSSAQLILNPSGNLGLGVTPSAWASGYKAFEFGNSSAAVSALFSNGANDFWSVSNAYFDGTSFKYITTGTATGYEQVNGSHKWYQVASGSGGTNISFTQAMTLDASGNLALGQTSSALQSGGTGVTLYGTSASEIKFLNSSTGSAATDGTALVTSSLNFSINNREAGDILLGTSNAERMRITSGGNVGIGTTSPTRLFEVSATNPAVSIKSTSATGYSELYFGDNTADNGYLSYAHNGDYLVFGVNNAERMRITSGGNVGIGTTTINGTGTVLALYNSTDAQIRLQSANTGQTASDGALVSLASDNSMYVYNYENTPLIFGTNNAERMRITSTGNVGIGTTSPTSKLSVSGTAGNVTTDMANGNLFDLYGGTISSANNGIGIGFTRAGSQMAYIVGARENATDEASFLAFATQNSTGQHPERMRITSGGELLINTTSDAGDYKLQVNGAGYFIHTAGVPSINARASDTNFALMSILGNQTGDVNWLLMSGYPNAGDFTIRQSDVINALTIAKTTGNATFGGSIKTAAPSGGTTSAKPWKFGAAGVTLGGSNLSGVEVDIDGTIYYLVTGYLPEPEPEAGAGPSGDTYSTKYEKPAIMTSPNTQKIKELEAEVAELKAMMKTLMNQKKK